ncbi:MAG TPA: AbrB/MazE/SpoVT family DNA-binding domain-containing protein [Tepidiformaceae bacterium]
MTRKGQITVPAEVREALGLKVGDRVAVRVDQQGTTATIEPADSVVERLYGVLSPKNAGGKNTAAQGAAAQAARERDERTKRG